MNDDLKNLDELDQPSPSRKPSHKKNDLMVVLGLVFGIMLVRPLISGPSGSS